jgi:hypothetical protein
LQKQARTLVDSQFSGIAKIQWARLRAEIGFVQEAVQQLTEAVPLLRARFPKRSYYFRSAGVQVARIFILANRFEEAKAYARESLEVVDRKSRYCDAVTALAEAEAISRKLPNEGKSLAEVQATLNKARKQLRP